MRVGKPMLNALRHSFISLALLLSMQATAHAHALHQSTAEAEYNPTTKHLEVSLRLFVADLDLALMRHSERRVSLETTPAKDLDPLIQAYLASVFVLKSADGKSIAIDWVGRESENTTAQGEDSAVTLYFELSLPQGLGGQTLQHSALCEYFADQSNLLLLKDGKRRQELRFTKPQASKRLAFSEP